MIIWLPVNRTPNKETEYTCKCGTIFKLKKSTKNPRCSKCLREEHNENARNAKYHLKDKYKLKQHKNRLRREYGIDETRYNQLLKQQGNVCAICGNTDSKNNRLCVDHNHTTGEIRGLLCHRCNRTLGTLKDNQSLFRSCLSYLMKFSSRKSWDSYFLDIAELVATRSKDPSTKVGAIIVKDKTIVATGYNGFPRGVNDNDTSRYDRPEKYLWTVHAEENVIFNACREGIKIDGSTLYVTPLSPCSNCALSIVQAGIKEVVFLKTVENVRFDESCKKAFEIFESCKVLTRKPE
jgi:dCMP deaminase